jgi:hypothetical protein
VCLRYSKEGSLYYAPMRKATMVDIHELITATEDSKFKVISIALMFISYNQLKLSHESGIPKETVQGVEDVVIRLSGGLVVVHAHGVLGLVHEGAVKGD